MASSEAESDWITVGEARALLGISPPKMAKLVKQGQFRLYEGDRLDKRYKLISRADVERLAVRPGRQRKPKRLGVAPDRQVRYGRSRESEGSEQG